MGGSVVSLYLKCPLGNQKVRGSNPTATMQVERYKWALGGRPNRRCPNGPPGPEWKTS